MAVSAPRRPKQRRFADLRSRIAELRPLLGRYWVVALIGLGAVGGLVVLGRAVGLWVAAVLIVFAAIATKEKLGRATLALLCAALVAMLALLAVNVVIGVGLDIVPNAWPVVPDDRLPIWAGLIVAFAVVALVAYAYLRATWLHPDKASASPSADDRRTHVATPEWERRGAALGGIGLACVVILALPPFVSWLREHNHPTPAPLPAERLAPRLDLVIVADGLRSDVAAERGAAPVAPAVDVQFNIGQSDGREVSWTRSGIERPDAANAALGEHGGPHAAPPQLRPRADSVIVLVVSRAGHCERRLEQSQDLVADVRTTVGGEIPVVALLATPDAATLRCWKGWTDLAAVEQVGSRTVADAAMAVGTVAVTAQPYYEVAFEYRPILLFDKDEVVPRPLSIEQMFDAGRIRQCPDLSVSGKCDTPPVSGPAELESPGMHLVIDEPKTKLNVRATDELEAWRQGRPSLGDGADEALGAGSRIYVNPVPVKSGTRQLLYLDYWWYLRDNPAGTGTRAFCGAGLVIVGVTCFNHESDWEGVTVELERAGDAWKPNAVHYAQHESVVRYAWEDLRKYWASRAPLTDDLGRISRHIDRPVVFVANGTHASYAHVCDQSCRQVVTKLEEGDHAGGLPWVGDDDEICAAVDCLALLPTTTGGRGPASWNAFAGPWGSRHCFLEHYCDSGTPPAAPGRQGRYKTPADYDGTADVMADDGGYKARSE